MLKTIHSKLGQKGKSSVQKFLETAGLASHAAAADVVREVFAEADTKKIKKSK